MKTSENLTIYDRLQDNLFDPAADDFLNDEEKETRQRIQSLFLIKTEKPYIPDRILIPYMVRNYNADIFRVIREINFTESLIVMARKQNKDFLRQLATETQKKVIDIELKRLADFEYYNSIMTDPADTINYSTKDLNDAIANLSTISQLDKVDTLAPDWDLIQPPIIEPTDDISSIDLEHIEAGTIERLKSLYMGKMNQIAQANKED